MKIVTNYKNLKYFKHVKITNKRQVRWTLKIQNILYQIEYRKEKDNIETNVLTRRENKTILKERKIFLNELTLNKVKEQEFYSRMNVTQLRKLEKE